jgi:4a-hydroxytetrahydrobiopterin dehydratase
MAEKLNDESIQGWLDGRSGWTRDGDLIRKEFSFDSFRDSIVFVNRVATLADTANHHPDIDIRYDTVTIGLSTHDAGGLTEKDLELAEQVDFATSSR